MVAVVVNNISNVTFVVVSLMNKIKSKPCDLCHNLAVLRYRIQYQENGSWVMVCPSCWQQVSQNNSHYRYGGTWKARNR